MLVVTECDLTNFGGVGNSQSTPWSFMLQKPELLRISYDTGFCRVDFDTSTILQDKSRVPFPLLTVAFAWTRILYISRNALPSLRAGSLVWVSRVSHTREFASRLRATNPHFWSSGYCFVKRSFCFGQIQDEPRMLSCSSVNTFITKTVCRRVMWWVMKSLSYLAYAGTLATRLNVVLFHAYT